MWNNNIENIKEKSRQQGYKGFFFGKKKLIKKIEKS